MDKQITFFKVYNLKYDKISNDEVYVFVGETFNNIDLNNEFKRDPFNEIFTNFFKKEEIETYKNDSIDVIFVNDLLYNDDNIQLIKFKIKNYLFKNTLTTNELYLFSKNKTYNYYENYFDLNVNYSKEEIEILLCNYNRYDLIDTLNENMEYYNINSIHELFFDKSEEIISMLENFSLQSKFKNSKILYPINPLDLKNIPSNALSNLQTNYETNHKTLLLDLHQEIFNNTMYCVTSQEFLKYINYERKDITEKMESSLLIKLYYPFLFENDIEINNVDEYNEKIIPIRKKKIMILKN